MQHLIDKQEQLEILNLAATKHPGGAQVDKPSLTKKKRINIAYLYSRGFVQYTIKPIMTDFNPAPDHLHITEAGMQFLGTQLTADVLGQSTRAKI